MNKTIICILFISIELSSAAGTWRAEGHALNVDEYAPGDQAITLKTCTQLAFENGYEIISDLGNSRFLYRRGEGDLWQVSPIPVKMQHSLLFNPADKRYYANDTANQRMIAFRDLAEAAVDAEATEMAGVKLRRPHDVVRDPATGWLYMINPNEPVVVRFRALGVDEKALSLDKELNYSRGLTFAKGRLYVIGSSVSKVIEITDFDKGAFRVYTGHGKEAEGPAGNWLRTGLVPNDAEWFDGWWYLTSFFTPAAPYSEPGDDFDTNKFIRFRDWAAFESGDWGRPERPGPERYDALLPHGARRGPLSGDIFGCRRGQRDSAHSLVRVKLKRHQLSPSKYSSMDYINMHFVGQLPYISFAWRTHDYILQ